MTILKMYRLRRLAWFWAARLCAKAMLDDCAFWCYRRKHRIDLIEFKGHRQLIEDLKAAIPNA